MEYFAQSMRADRKAYNYSSQQYSVSEIGSAGYKQLKSGGGKVVRYSYRSVQRLRDSRRISTRQRQRFTAPMTYKEDVAPLMVSLSGEQSGKTAAPGGYGALTTN